MLLSLLVISVLIGLATFAVFLRRPAWAVFAIVFCVTINLPTVLSRSFGFGVGVEVILAGLFGLMLCYRILYRDRQQGMAPFLLALGVWWLGVLISLQAADSVGDAVTPLRQIAPALLLAIGLVLVIETPQRLIAAFLALAIGGSGLAALTVIQYGLDLQGSDFWGLARGQVEHISGQVDAFRPSGPISDPNYYAQSLLPALAICLVGVFHTRLPLGRVAATLGALLIACAIVLTASRGALIAVSVLVTLVLIMERKGQLVAVLAGVILATILLAPSYFQRLEQSASAVSAVVRGGAVHETSIQGRLDEMRAAARMFRDNPWVGLGYGGFESRFQEVTVREDLELRHADRSSHSYYLEVGAEQGLVGLACLSVLVALAVWVTRAGHRAALGSGDRRLAQAVLGFGLGGLAVLVGSVFLHDAHPHYFWLVVALVFAGGRVVRSPARQATGILG